MATTSYQFEEVDEFVGVFSGGEVHEVPRDSVPQTGTGLNRDLAGRVAKRRAFLHIHAIHITTQPFTECLSQSKQ